MDKTAMAQMLTQLKLQLGAEKVSQVIDDCFWLDQERQQIEEAFKAGVYSAMTTEQTSSEYYQSKYTKGG